eukprot:6475044-Amphidinium_carterae.1
MKTPRFLRVKDGSRAILGRAPVSLWFGWWGIQSNHIDAYLAAGIVLVPLINCRAFNDFGYSGHGVILRQCVPQLLLDKPPMSRGGVTPPRVGVEGMEVLLYEQQSQSVAASRGDLMHRGQTAVCRYYSVSTTFQDVDCTFEKQHAINVSILYVFIADFVVVVVVVVVV